MKEENEEETRDSGLSEYNIEGQEPDAEETSVTSDTLDTSEPGEEEHSVEDISAPEPPKKHHAYLGLWLLVSLSIIVVMAV